MLQLGRWKLTCLRLLLTTPNATGWSKTTALTKHKTEIHGREMMMTTSRGRFRIVKACPDALEDQEGVCWCGHILTIEGAIHFDSRNHSNVSATDFHALFCFATFRLGTNALSSHQESCP